MTHETIHQVTGTVQTSDAIKGYALIKFWQEYPGTDYLTKLPTIKRRPWTAWFDVKQEQVQAGDTITIRGDLSAKVDTYTPKDATEPVQVVAFNLNNCQIVAHDVTTRKAPAAAAAAPYTPAQPLEPLDAPF